MRKRLSEACKTRLFSPLPRNKSAPFSHALGCLSAGNPLPTVRAVFDAVRGGRKDCFHVAACRYPYHFRERLRDCPGDKVYLILADFAGRKYNTLSQKFVFHVVLLIFCGAKMVPGLTKTPYAEI